ncbi:hypothetical protein CVT25_008913 [Psilocybe cyanescens]|uniref:Zn(2)-C6 fungal-type domain-containing protein n=1 Tax=Psilocybe cyanescens TaxID=93625 RepID=A0A409XMX9_PSICY|nr:hypothetical protein CVT25_008913 [Psilocybe cyanescens]
MPVLILIVITYSASSSSSPLSALMSLEIINQIHNKLCVITIDLEEYKHELKQLFEQLRRAYRLHTSEHGNSPEPDSALWFNVYMTLTQGINKGLNGNERLRPRYEQVQALVVAFEKDEGKENQMRADEQSNFSKAAPAVLSGDQHDGSIAEAAVAATDEVQIEETAADNEVQTEPATTVIPTAAAANSSKPSQHSKIRVVEIPPRKVTVTRNPALSNEEEGNLNKSRNHPIMMKGKGKEVSRVEKGKGKEVLRMESDDKKEEEVEKPLITSTSAAATPPTPTRQARPPIQRMEASISSAHRPALSTSAVEGTQARAACIIKAASARSSKVREWTKGEVACRSCIRAQIPCPVMVNKDNGAHACMECNAKKKCPLAVAKSPILGFGTTINFEMADDLSGEVFNPNACAARWILEDMERKWAMPEDFGGILMNIVSCLRVVRDDHMHLMLEFQKLKETVNRLASAQNNNNKLVDDVQGATNVEDALQQPHGNTSEEESSSIDNGACRSDNDGSSSHDGEMHAVCESYIASHKRLLRRPDSTDGITNEDGAGATLKCKATATVARRSPSKKQKM